MHNGSSVTLAEVIDYYDSGGQKNPALDPMVRPLRLTPEEKQNILAFLASLAGRIQEGE